MNLPNILSFLRILSVPLFIWLMLEKHIIGALCLFTLAGLTDALDGFIAKRFGMETELGKYLDPLADKLLLMAGFITLTSLGFLPSWLMLLVVTRDVLIVGGALLYQMVTGALYIEPLWTSKLNTVFQMFLLVFVLFNAIYALWPSLLESLIWLTAMTTLVSGGEYVFEWSRRAVCKEQELVK